MLVPCGTCLSQLRDTQFRCVSKYDHSWQLMSTHRLSHSSPTGDLEVRHSHVETPEMQCVKLFVLISRDPCQYHFLGRSLMGHPVASPALVEPSLRQVALPLTASSGWETLCLSLHPMSPSGCNASGRNTATLRRRLYDLCAAPGTFPDPCGPFAAHCSLIRFCSSLHLVFAGASICIVSRPFAERNRVLVCSVVLARLIPPPLPWPLSL
jgi:hypothetical protein